MEGNTYTIVFHVPDGSDDSDVFCYKLGCSSVALANIDVYDENDVVKSEEDGKYCHYSLLFRVRLLLQKWTKMSEYHRRRVEVLWYI